MSSGETPVNIARLMATFNIEMRALPDDLKCAECKSVLKDTCQVSCGCRFCRTCIDSLMARGGQFCPGDSQECGVTSLSTAAPDYRADKSIMRLTAKCPHAGCPHECPLADMEGHLRVCSRKSVACPFRDLGCPQDGLAAADMSSHIQQESGSHSEILIGLVAGIKRDMEMLKQELAQKDEREKHLENELKLIKDEIKSVKYENKSIREENESMKNEIRSIKIENESIKQESDERANAGTIAITGEVTSNRDALGTELEPVRGDIQSIKEKLESMKCQIGSVQVAVGLVQLDDWLIDEDVEDTQWMVHNDITSSKFSRARRAHTFELVSGNYTYTLKFWLRIWAGPSDAQLQWPFRGAVTITVAHRDNAEKCVRQMLEYCILSPPDNKYSWGDAFTFEHYALRRAGLDLERGVRVSCQIVPERASDAVPPCVTISSA